MMQQKHSFEQIELIGYASPTLKSQALKCVCIIEYMFDNHFIFQGCVILTSDPMQSKMAVMTLLCTLL